MKIRNMKDIFYSVSDELLSVTKDLAVPVCRSHVLQSLLCMFGDVWKKRYHRIWLRKVVY